MIQRIKKLNLLRNLDYQFNSMMEKVIYDVNEDVDTLPGYNLLKENNGLFENVQLDESRTCVFWNEYIDIPSDAIYEYGTPVT